MRPYVRVKECFCDDAGTSATALPSKSDIYELAREVLLRAQLRPEALAVALLYLTRLRGGLTVAPGRWRRLVTAAILLGSKAVNDDAFENAELAQILPYTLDEIDALEQALVWALGSDVSVTAAEYVKTCFLLKTLGATDVDTLSSHGSLGPPQLCQEQRAHLVERCTA